MTPNLIEMKYGPIICENGFKITIKYKHDFFYVFFLLFSRHVLLIHTALKIILYSIIIRPSILITSQQHMVVFISNLS